jgi:rhodanese-related sulfurtransferase
MNQQMRHFACMAVVVIATCGHACAHAQLNVDQMREAMAAGSAVVFDIREPAEHAKGVAQGMRLLPMSQLGARLNELPKDTSVLLICNTQNRSKAVVAELQKRGWTNVQFVNGGMKEWADRKLPLALPGSVQTARSASASKP